MEKWLKEQGEQLAKLEEELQKVKGPQTMGSRFRDFPFFLWLNLRSTMPEIDK